MIEPYRWIAPGGREVTICPQEAGMPCPLAAVNIGWSL